MLAASERRPEEAVAAVALDGRGLGASAFKRTVRRLGVSIAGLHKRELRVCARPLQADFTALPEPLVYAFRRRRPHAHHRTPAPPPGAQPLRDARLRPRHPRTFLYALFSAYETFALKLYFNFYINFKSIGTDLTRLLYILVYILLICTRT